MKNVIILLAVVLVLPNAHADVIVSLAFKKSNDSTKNTNTIVNNNTTITNNCNPAGKKCTTTSEATTSSTTNNDDNTASGIDTGLLIQYVPNDGGLSVGIGLFNDSTGMTTIGWSFK